MKGELLENRIVVWNTQESRDLFANGYFGKPIGIPKPNVNDINVPLILDLIEGCYLQEISKIKIVKNGKKVSLNSLIKNDPLSQNNIDLSIRVSKFDNDKLISVNSHYILELKNDEIIKYYDDHNIFIFSIIINV